ncbi:hypothetical protein L541_4342, partial [Bordetella hinzii CA90 BAL1384]
MMKELISAGLLAGAIVAGAAQAQDTPLRRSRSPARRF